MKGFWVSLQSAAMIAALGSSPGVADSPNYFAYHPESPMQLGRGFVQNDLGKVFTEVCLEFERKPAYSGTGAEIATLSTSVVRDYASLLEKVGVDARVGVHFPMGGFDAKFQQNRQSFSATTNVTVVVQAHAEYGSVTIAPKWKPEFRQLLDQGQVDVVLARCGARVPVTERRAVALNAIVTIFDVSTSTQSAIATSLSGSYGFGPVQAELSVALNKEMQEAKKSGRLALNVVARGGDPSELFSRTIEAAVKNAVSLDEIGAALASFANTLTVEKAAAVGFFVGDMPQIDVALKDPWNVEKQSRIAELAALYFTVRDKRTQIQGVVQRQDPRHAAYSEVEMAKLSAAVDGADSIIGKILNQHGACKAALPPAIDVCQISTSIKKDVAGVLAVPLLLPPAGEFKAAWRTYDATRESFSDWTLFNPRQTKAILTSTQRAPDESLIDYDSLPNGYLKDLKARVFGQKEDMDRYALGFMLTSEHLERVEIVARSDGIAEHRSELWEPTKLDDNQFRPNSLLEAESDYAGGRRRYVVWMIYDLAKPPAPPPPGCSAMTARRPECKRHMDRYLDPMNFEMGFYPWIDFAAVAKVWLRTKPQGTGRFMLRAHDAYAGERAFELIEFKWDRDDDLGIARVEYRVAGGEPNVWFVPQLTDASDKFPVITPKYRLSYDNWRAGPPQAKTFDAPQDKWGALSIKWCGGSASFADPASAQVYAVELTSDPRSLRAVITKRVPSGSTSVAIDLALKAVAQTNRASAFGPGFYDSRSGCD